MMRENPFMSCLHYLFIEAEWSNTQMYVNFTSFGSDNSL